MNSRSPKYQSGVALLAALILMLAVVVILGNIFYRHQIDITQATASMHGDQALLLAMSGEGWASGSAFGHERRGLGAAAAVR